MTASKPRFEHHDKDEAMTTSTTTIDLTKMSSSELAEALRSLPVEQWNDTVRVARGEVHGWRADLRGADLWRANLWGADLWRADLWGANLGRANLGGADLRGANLRGADLWGANLGGANLWRADLGRADLWRADLRGANLGDHKLTGRSAILGECAGYPVLMFASEQGHVLRAGCWTGVLDDAVERAVEESDSELVRVEAEAVVAHGRAILKAWEGLA